MNKTDSVQDEELDKILLPFKLYMQPDNTLKPNDAYEAYERVKQDLAAYVERSNHVVAVQGLLDEAVNNRDGLPKVWPGLGKWMYEFFNARVVTLQRELDDAKKGILW